MDAVEKPEDSEQEDDDLEAEKIAFEMMKLQNAMASKESVLEIVPGQCCEEEKFIQQPSQKNGGKNNKKRNKGGKKS